MVIILKSARGGLKIRVKGFECFKKNSFEQLCINFTNEKLQAYFNDCIFKYEQAMYVRENVPWEDITFPDNMHIISLIVGKPKGIFPMLDDECKGPKPSDKGFIDKLKRTNTPAPKSAEEE